MAKTKKEEYKGIYYLIRFKDNGINPEKIIKQFNGAEPIESIHQLLDKDGVKERDLRFFYKVDSVFEDKISKFMDKGIIIYKSRAIKVYASRLVIEIDDRFLYNKPINKSVD